MPRPIKGGTKQASTTATSQNDDRHSTSLSSDPVAIGSCCCDPGCGMAVIVVGGILLMIGGGEYYLTMLAAEHYGTCAAVGTGVGLGALDIGGCYWGYRNAEKEERRAKEMASASSASETKANGHGFFERLFCCGHKSASSERTPLVVHQPVVFALKQTSAASVPVTQHIT